MENNLDKITRILIYFLVFLLPLWFLPWTGNVLDFNKQALLVIFTFLALFCWLLKSLTEGKISLNLSYFNISVLALLLILGFSTYFSAYRYASFWGLPLNIASSFLTILSFVLLYFLILNNFRKREVFGLVFLLISSGTIAGLFSGFQLFGRFLLPFDFARQNSFNLIGTLNSLGIFLAGLLPLILTFFFISKRVIKILLFLFSLVIFGILLIINFWVAWIVLLTGSISILVFGISQREKFKPNWLTLPMFLLVVSIFFGIFKIGIPGLPFTPLEVSPSQRTSFNIAKAVLREKPILGTGPGTFLYNYSRFKPETLNQTAFWAIRFATGASDILDKLATIGILGILAFLGLVGHFLVISIKKLIEKKKKEEEIIIKGISREAKIYDWILTLGIFSSFLGIFTATLFYPVNVSLSFLFWILMASLLVLMETKKKSWILEPASKSSILVSFFFILALVFGIAICFMQGQRYLAEVRYRQGLEAWQRGDNQEAVNLILRAISFTGGSQDNYWRDLAQLYLFRIQEELQREAPAEEISRAITPLVSNAINSAKAATDTAPKNVANWSVRGFVYRQMANLLEGAVDWAKKSYERAIELEPTNPYLYTELGRVYLVKEDTDEARAKFQKALELKSDYAPARFQIALLYVREGKIKEAITEMENAKELSPFDVGVAFQLGLLYYNDEQYDKAKAELERAVSLNENYSNARYFLGLIYDREGRKDEAVLQFEKIAKLNPENEQIKKILDNLKAGKPALEGLVPPEEEVPPETPIEEKPEEVLE